MKLRNVTRSLMGAGALLALAVAQPVMAQDDDNSGDGDNDTTETVLLLSALGLTAPDGNTELGEGAGQLESHMILAQTLDTFGSTLTTELLNSDEVNNNDKVILWAGDGRFSLGMLALVESRLAVLGQRIFDAGELCPPPASDGDGPVGIKGVDGDGDSDGGTRIDLSGTGIARTLVDLLRSDTEFSGVTLDPSEELVVNAVASADGLRYVIPSDVAYQDNSSILAAYTAQAERVSELAQKPCAKVDKSPEKAFVTLMQSSLAALSNPGKDGAASMLEQAIMMEPLRPDHHGAPIKVLRLNVEMAGGTIEQRSNIWTTLGLYSGVRISGGMVGSYRMTDGMDGSVITSGVFYCTAPIRSFGDANRAPRTNTQGSCTIK